MILYPDECERLTKELETLRAENTRLREQRERLVGAVREVTDCLILENMERPHFTFSRIEKLSAILAEIGEKK